MSIIKEKVISENKKNNGDPFLTNPNLYIKKETFSGDLNDNINNINYKYKKKDISFNCFISKDDYTEKKECKKMRRERQNAL